MDSGNGARKSFFFMAEESRHRTNLKDVLESRHLYRLRYGDVCGQE